MKIPMLLLSTALLAGPCLAAPDSFSGDGGVSGFYRWTAPLPATPGLMLRRQPMAPALKPDHAGRAERILYSATDGIDEARQTAVSGAVFFPRGKTPSGGWPIIAWAHGTTGVADVCAPSWRQRTPRDNAYLNAWLDHGFAVVATDYQGLGTAGSHPYLLYKPEGYDVLDSVRAALSAFPKALTNKVVILGHSQGAGAALGAALLAPDYAPGLHVLGTVATGLVAEIANPGDAPQIAEPPSEGSDAVDAAYEILFFLGTARSLDPSAEPDAYIAAAGRPLLEAAQTSCFRDLIEVARNNHIAIKDLYSRDIDALNALQKQYGSLPKAHIDTPVFTGTGLADSAAPTASQYNLVSALCRAGTTVDWHYYPGATHSGSVMQSLNDSLAFVDHLTAGKPVPGNCAALQPPGPTQAANPAIPGND